MLNLIKPGHVLQFGTCPSTLTPPSAPKGANDNTRADEWPNDKKNLGAVRCLTHPSGPLGPICADVATSFRGGGLVQKIRRGVSYSPIGGLVRSQSHNQNVQVGAATADFVGYTDGRTNYVRSQEMVFSKDFSGCLMVVYTKNGVRHVAHAAASKRPDFDCKQAFLNKLRGEGAQLSGWFRPYMASVDDDRKIPAFGVVGKYMSLQINNFTTFGVVAGGQAYSIDAFKPSNCPGNTWVVTSVIPKTMSTAWTV